jgi:hypothetical protein
MARSTLVFLTAALGFAASAAAQDDEPDLSFLEYLGSWQEGDEEWLIVAEMAEELKETDEASGKDEKTDESDEN